MGQQLVPGLDGQFASGVAVLTLWTLLHITGVCFQLTTCFTHGKLSSSLFLVNAKESYDDSIHGVEPWVLQGPEASGVDRRHASMLSALDSACRGIELVQDVECSWCSFKYSTAKQLKAGSQGDGCLFR